MPTPRNPILVDVNTSFRNWQIETNAITNIINYFIRSSDGIFVADSVELSNAHISLGDISNVSISGSTSSGNSHYDSFWRRGEITDSHIGNPTVSGVWDFNTATLNIQSGTDADRLNKGFGTPVEMFYSFTDNLLYIFDGTVDGGRPFYPNVDIDNPQASEVTLTDASNIYDALNVEDALVELAGEGRTTETVAQNAEDIASLGTAAQADVTTSATDTTAGRLMEVGYLGLGGELQYDGNLDDLNGPTRFIYATNSATGKPYGMSSGRVLHFQQSTDDISQLWFDGNSNKTMYFRTKVAGAWGVWYELYHSGNYPSDSAWTTTTSLLNGWTGTVSYIKRAGMVTIRVEAANGSSKTSDGVLVLASAYRPAVTCRNPATSGEIAVASDGSIALSGSTSGIDATMTYPVIT